MKMIFDLDMDKCVACGACAVACMDQNDIHPEAGEELFRTVGIVEPVSQGRALGFLSLGCMHCADAPCIAACPTVCTGSTSSREAKRQRRCSSCCLMRCSWQTVQQSPSATNGSLSPGFNAIIGIACTGMPSARLSISFLS